MKKSKNNNIILGFGYWVFEFGLVDAKERSLISKQQLGKFEINSFGIGSWIRGVR